MEDEFLMCTWSGLGNNRIEHSFSMSREIFELYNSLLIASKMLDYIVVEKMIGVPKIHSGIAIQKSNDKDYFVHFHSDENKKLSKIDVGYTDYGGFGLIHNRRKKINDPIEALTWVIEQIAAD